MCIVLVWVSITLTESNLDAHGNTILRVEEVDVVPTKGVARLANAAGKSFRGR